MLKERLERILQSEAKVVVLCKGVPTAYVDAFLENEEQHAAKLNVIDRDDAKSDIIVCRDPELPHELGGNTLADMLRDAILLKFGRWHCLLLLQRAVRIIFYLGC